MRLPVLEPSPQGGRHRAAWLTGLSVCFVLSMSSLVAIVDVILDPHAAYINEMHLIVGIFTGVMVTLLLAILALHSSRLEKAISRQQADAEALTRSEEKYRSLFEGSMDAIFIRSLDGDFTDINPAGVKMLGFGSREEMLGIDTAHELCVNHDIWVRHQRLLEREGVVENFEIELRRKDGSSIIVMENSTAVRDSDGRITSYRGSLRDVTRQKQMEAELQQVQKMESIGRMAGGIAHDFNNYLTTICGQTDLALEHVVDDGPVRDSLRAIAAAAEKATGLTSEMMLFSRSQPLNLQVVELNATIARVREMLVNNYGSRAGFVLEPAPDPVLVEADAGNIERVIFNLASHACETVPAGGEVTIAIREKHIDEKYSLSHPEAYPGEFARVSITDNGNGMDTETVSRIFEPFVDVGRGDGTSMALAVAYGIVMQHGGWIEVDSMPDFGTTYHLYVPASSREAVKAAKGGEVLTDGDFHGNGERILLVEDEEAVRTTIARMLHNNGYNVLTAADARQAFDIFVSEAGNIQLVFSDVGLPGESGVALVEHLRSHKRMLPVILSSGFTDRDEDLQIIREKDYRFLQKPFALPDLLRMVRDLLQASSMS
ncbi:MAG: hybrid sensor histidine kinase/response regulator [Thermoleophilia bacterium]